VSLDKQIVAVVILRFGRIFGKTHFVNASKRVVSQVVAFPVGPKSGYCLTQFDISEARRWAVNMRSFFRLVVCDDHEDVDEIGDFLLFHRVNETWSAWGLARRGTHIVMWNSLSGVDVGNFPSVATALDAIDVGLSERASSTVIRPLKRRRGEL
jgi:hypothetical protein